MHRAPYPPLPPTQYQSLLSLLGGDGEPLTVAMGAAPRFGSGVGVGEVVVLVTNVAAATGVVAILLGGDGVEGKLIFEQLLSIKAMARAITG